MKAYFLFVFSFFCLLSISAYSQVEIEMNSGEKFKGIVVSDTKDSMIINTEDNVKISLPKSEIESIVSASSTVKLKNGLVYSGHISKMSADNLTIRTTKGKELSFQRTDISDIRRSVNKDNYGLFGVTILTPSGFNLVGGYHFGTFGFRAEVGGIPNAGFGIQGNFLWNLYHGKSFEHNLSLCVGHMNLTTKESNSYGGESKLEFTYFGPCYDINWGGFFVELGLGVGSGSITKSYENGTTNVPSPQVLFQLGYVYRGN